MAFTNIYFLAFMLLIISMLIPCSSGYVSGNDYGTKKQVVTKKPNFTEKLFSNNIGIQGLVYCKSDSKLIPLEGAVVRITCEAVDEYGFETTPFTFLSDATDVKGFFLATLFQLELVAEKRVLKECRAFLDASPSNNCNYPTDVNKGISGAELHSYPFLLVVISYPCARSISI
ncbi:protein SEED AND ROOT HAIR PROTECTIVE PROTEIN-like [Vicia villosa]|uniref:protein SEED AND ROOT HAIR PROTECTIVE PROTEIN-like n=1 Tax=Vicia villosa TaxID=3911 RepID=UPI00273AAD40|nr:protein SEED AND ROOT HAIR PROTECTIVE PROTEIN-like [Vicia villosa]